MTSCAWSVSNLRHCARVGASRASQRRDAGTNRRPLGARRGGAGWGGQGEAHHAVVGDLQHELAVTVPILHDVPCLRKQVRRSASGDGRGRAAGCAHVQDAPRTASPPPSRRCPSPLRAPCGQPGCTSAQRGSAGRCRLVVTRQAAVRPAKRVTRAHIRSALCHARASRTAQTMKSRGKISSIVVAVGFATRSALLVAREVLPTTQRR